ncbi:hypothetical protein SYK_25550 [Pseudodesulfovibrio nedwellii]|uniref:Uncharacterized protein n=1 Tax=Pseudodesulfovibrio nedwellii TaxID=2973072 RepID=A0ABN6S8P6_9BACT|nr:MULTISPECIES: hypothetical protein [Pseudodesulfovibrio]BDQ38195.1 hypothetical protein SYK_25550 [Pseudodesulfovibrio nedwellii]
MTRHIRKALIDMAGHVAVAAIVFGLCYWWSERIDFSFICSSIIIAGGIKNSIMTYNYEKRHRVK